MLGKTTTANNGKYSIHHSDIASGEYYTVVKRNSPARG